MTIPDRIAARIEVADCWQWTGYVAPDGYGSVWNEKRTRVAHRVVYELLVRPLDRDEQLDHLCRNRRCVNPDHLEVVTARTNILRGFGAPAQSARRTACRFGHPYSALPNGKRRVCRLCVNASVRKYRAKTGGRISAGALSKGEPR